MRALWLSSKAQRPESSRAAQHDLFESKPVATGEPLLVSIGLLDEDPANPRTEFPEAELGELAEDIRQRGVLQAIVVQPADAAGRYRIHFGAKRLRAAKRAGLHQVPVTIRAAEPDPYSQVAENQKRHGFSPIDLARFIQGRVDAGESNATISRRLGMDLTTVAHHLALLSLPPVLDEALKTGRCTSPRTLYELSKLHDEQPEQVCALVASDAPITRAALADLKVNDLPETAPRAAGSLTVRRIQSMVNQANALCTRLESVLNRLSKAEDTSTQADVAALRQRIADLAKR